MRRLTFTLLLIAASATISNAQLVNGDMEAWKDTIWASGPGTSGNTYEDLGPNYNRLTNTFRSINGINDAPIPVTGPLTCWQSDTAHSGLYSARLKSTLYAGSIFIPGFLGTGDVDLPQQTIHLGRQYTQQPDSFSVWYMYAPVSTDSAKFEVVLTHFDALNQVSDTVAMGSMAIHGAASTWTHVTFPLNWLMAQAPDTAIIICASSGGYDLENLTACTGQVGSQLWVDDIMLYSGNLGFDNEDYISDKVNIYPNPASDFVNISTTDLPANLKLFVYDVNGKMVMAKTMNGNNYQLEVSELPNGIYGVVIQDNFNLIHRSKIIKK